MSNDNADVPFERVCSECGHVNETPTDYCLYCGAPLGFGPGAPAIAAWSVFGVASPFVGRQAELHATLDAIRDAVEEQRATLIVLTGPEGAGRTRFLDALNAQVVDAFPDALMPKAFVRTDHDHPYAPVAELLKERFYVPRDADPDAFRARLSDGVRALVGAERGDEVADRIAAMLGLPDTQRVSGGEETERGWRRALVDVFRADAARQPLVLAFDDIDRAGGETRALVRTLVPELANAPVAFVVSASSPEAFAATVGDLDAGNVTHIPLGPLADTEVEALTRTLLERVDELPDAVVQRVIDASLGNPLIAEEAIRVLIRDDVIDTRGNAWTVDGDRLASIALPSQVEDMVRARLDLLTDDEGALLQHAALIGESFWLGAVEVLVRAETEAPADIATLSATNEDPSVLERVQALVRRDILRESEASGLRGEREFTFKHHVERRLHAERIEADEARRGHRLVAQWLQLRSSEDPEPFLVAIAEHHAAGGMDSQAAEFYARAGRLCADRYVNDRALRHLRSALALVPDDDHVSGSVVLGEIGTLCLLGGENEAARAAFLRQARAAWRLGSSRRMAAALLGLGRAERARGEYDSALALFEDARARYEQLDDVAGIADALDDAGRIQWIRGDYDAAEREYGRALALRRALDEPIQLAASLSHMGTLLVHRGQFNGALERFREALDIRKRAGDLRGIAESQNTIGYIFAERGDAASAVRIWSEAVGVARDAGDRGLEGVLTNNLGEAELMRNDLAKAEEHLKRAVEIAEATGDRRVVFDAVRNLGVLQSRKGNLSLALDHADEALEMAKALKSRAMEGVALRTIGELHGMTAYDDSDDRASDLAEAAFRSAVDIFRELRNDAELGRTYHAFGTHLLERRQLVQGKKHLEMAREIFERLEMRRILAQTEATIHEL